MKKIIALLAVCLICHSCFADSEEPSSAEKLKPMIEKNLEMIEGYRLPEEVSQIVETYKAELRDLEGQFNKLKAQSEIIRSRMKLVNQAVMSEAYIFLASKGIPREDMGNWLIGNGEIKRVPKK